VGEIIALLERGLLDEVAAIYELKELGGKIADLATRFEVDLFDDTAAEDLK
jgi:hypothetical protein